VKLHLPTVVWLAASAWALGAATAASTANAAGAAATSASRLEVRVVTGAQELSAGGSLELRIYEGAKGARHVPLTHGEAWPRDSTHLIPVRLTEPLDPRNVVRFSLYYRSASPLAPDLEIVAADVELPSTTGTPELLLGATLSGVVGRQGELATMDRDQSALACSSDADCDDKRTCNGQERCAPHSPGADARGCVKGTPVACPVNQVCSEGVGCRGLAGAPKP
jgi:hypothetical protein